MNALAGFGDVTTYLDGRIDTGLTRPDYFNWPAELQVDLANQQPQLVVVMIGANDPQGLVTPDGASVTDSPDGTRPTPPGWPRSSPRPMRRRPRAVGRDAAHAGPGLDAALKHLNGLVAGPGGRGQTAGPPTSPRSRRWATSTAASPPSCPTRRVPRSTCGPRTAST